MTDRIPLFHGSLGRGIAWVCLVSPVVTAPVLSREFFELSPGEMVVAVAGNAVPAWGVPLAVHAALRGARPLVARTGLVGLVGVSTAAAIAAALVLRPAMILFSNAEPPALGFAASCAVMTWAFVLPAAVIERHADRREATELLSIRSRSHPHFLFNAMNTVASLIHDEPALAEATVERLAGVLRYGLVHAADDLVPLDRELAMIREYLDVQRARFGDRLRYTIAVAAGRESGVDAGETSPPASAWIPPLLLLPLVENAVVHGIDGRHDGGLVTIEVRTLSDRLELTVRNPVGAPLAPLRAPGAAGTGTGLRDLRRRVELLFDGRGALDTRADRRGFTARLVVPR